MNNRNRRGFTLVELLVVITIIGILIMLLLPAMAIIRELSRRMTCQSNISQLNKGLAHYHETYGTFPPGLPSCNLKNWHTWSTQQGNVCSGLSWVQSILSELGEQTLYDAFFECMDYERSGCDDCEHSPSDIKPGRSTPKVLICPSADVMTKWLGNNYDANVSRCLERLAKGNYVCNMGWGAFIPDARFVRYSYNEATGELISSTTNPNPQDPTTELPTPLFANDMTKAGAFAVVQLAGWEKTLEPKPVLQAGSKQSSDSYMGSTSCSSDPKCGRWKMGFGQGSPRASFRDGLSSTIMISEIVGWDSHSDSRGCWQCGCVGCSTFTTRFAPNSDQRDRLAICDDFPPNQGGIPSDNELFCDEPPALKAKGKGGWGNGSVDASVNDVWASARSRHSGGVVVGMGDASVRFFQNDVNIILWHALSTRAGGEQDYVTESGGDM